ncbi:MAG: aminoacyl-tRNA hydrolase [Sedimentisphaerales bacterium]|nr:aminoacyl-tRNA hydrolase [Sedimentisphaerales bacterium]
MDGPEIKMVVGLGNPGEEYVDTRHNVGFRVIDVLADVLRIDVRKKRFGACLGSGEFADKKIILLKPMRFMNCSGEVVATAAGFYKLASSNLLVVNDDMALPPGRIRVRMKGSAGGHNGLADVIEKLGTENISRLRIGIGQSDEKEAYDYVLDKPTEAERPLLDEAIAKARDAVLCWIEYGIKATMNKFNPPEADQLL